MGKGQDHHDHDHHGHDHYQNEEVLKCPAKKASKDKSFVPDALMPIDSIDGMDARVREDKQCELSR